MKKRVYLVNPQTPDNFWAMQGAIDVVGTPKTLMPNAALLTLIALSPPELDIEHVYCDENVAPIDWDMDCDLVGVTGYTLQSDRMREIARRFRDRGVAVAIGGTHATLDPDSVRDVADHLFIGEAEHTWPRFLRDWVSGRPDAVYRQDSFVDVKESPAPDLSYVKTRDYLYFSVQTSRGCPNQCDFCDVVRVAGRAYRSKTLEQIMREVKGAQARGAETVFFSDDNFFVNRKFTIELLRELTAYNRTLGRPLSFAAQATVMIGADEELLKLLADARFSVIFLGVEALRKECLEDVNKGQMARYDPFKVIPRISSYGIVPFLGLIVGFDHDTTAVFQEIEEFLDATASPLASISILNAPKNTPLYERMKEQGRLVEDFRGFWHLTTNVVPARMTLEELYRGHKHLFKELYEPERFERRMIHWLERVEYFTDLYSTRKKSLFRFFLLLRVLRHFTFRVPKSVRKMFYNVLRAAFRIQPRLVSRVISTLVQYWHYYDFGHNESWQDARLGE